MRCCADHRNDGGWSDDLEVVVSAACGVMGAVDDGPLPGGALSPNLPGGTLGPDVSVRFIKGELVIFDVFVSSPLPLVRTFALCVRKLRILRARLLGNRLGPAR